MHPIHLCVGMRVHGVRMHCSFLHLIHSDTLSSHHTPFSMADSHASLSLFIPALPAPDSPRHRSSSSVTSAATTASSVSSSSSPLALDTDCLPSYPHIFFPHEVGVIHLSLHQPADVVLHYSDVDYHAHSHVLHHHSAFFRAHLDCIHQHDYNHGLRGTEGSGTRERRGRQVRLDASLPFTLLATPTCHHSSLLPCIRLPQRVGLMPTTAADFLRFLRHLYFASTLTLPPFSPSHHREASLTHSTPPSPTFPSTSPVNDDMWHYSADRTTTGAWDESLLSLFHYFGCTQALRRCEQVLLHAITTAGNAGAAWYWLPVSVRYGMNGVERVCLDMVGSDVSVVLDGSCAVYWQQPHLIERVQRAFERGAMQVEAER